MSLKEILGEDYKENMTDEEINSAMEKRFLATGKYENKEKVDAERRLSAQKQKDLEAKIKSKLTDDELSKKEMEDLKAELESIKAEKAESDKKHSRTISSANMAEAKTLLEIKEADKEFEEFITAISGENSEIAAKTSSYVMRLVKDAYEKGKAFATKESLGEMGKQVIGSNGKAVDKDQLFVKGLIDTAPKTVNNQNSNFI